MVSAKRRADELLLGHERSVKNKSGGFYSKGGQKKYAPKAGSGIKNLAAAGNKSPEVMVKITNKGNSAGGAKGVKNHLDYISRNGKLPIETSDGRKLQGKAALNEVTKKWSGIGIIEDKAKTRQALNIVLSMPAATDPEKLYKAARAFAQEVFNEHEYAMALHTDTDHPHVHLCVTMQNYKGERINPRKNDLYEWRVLFADRMREQGIECAATKRVHRGQFQKAENSTVRNIVQRGGNSYIDKARKDQLIEAIKNNERPIHPYLREQLETNNLMVSELTILSRELYKQGLKTEARAVSNLSNQLKQAKPITKAQEQFDAEKQKTIEIKPEELER